MDNATNGTTIFFVLAIIVIGLGIWWYRYSQKNHPGKVDRTIDKVEDKAQELRDRARAEYNDRFGPKP